MFKPMLAGKAGDIEELEYPLFGSPKLDGIRCLIISGQPMSRNLKPIPNRVIQQVLGGLPAMDGEIIVGPPSAPDAFQKTSSGVMSAEGIPEFKFWVFDVVLRQPMPFNERNLLAKQWAGSCGKNVEWLPHRLIKTPDALRAYELEMLALGYEGVMIRSLDGPYKFGRSTLNEGYLLKIKRFEDSEAEVLGTVEKMHNANELQRDNLGRAKRTTHKAGKVATGVMGALVVRDIYSDVEFQIGAGFTDEQRTESWETGEVVKYRFQPSGVKDKPRFPVFLGRRHAEDL